MTKLLEQAIERVRDLPEEKQDALATTLFYFIAPEPLPVIDLDAETQAAIEDGLSQVRRGEFVAEEEIDALWKRHNV